MKIVDINPFFYPFEGGIEHRMHDTSKLLARKGHDVTVLTSRLPDTAEEETTPDGYKIVRLRSKFINVYNPPFVSSEGVAEAIAAIDPDIVNFNYRWAPSYTKDLKRYDGKKVFTYHNMWGEGIGLQASFSKMNDDRFVSCLDTFDHIIAVSDYVRNDLIRRGYSPGYVTTVQSGLREFPKIGKVMDGRFILSLGRQVKTKGLEYLIEAMKDVDCKLIMCGKGPESDRLAKQISKLGLEDKIEMKGWVSDEEKRELMASCEFFVMPSLFESLGLAAIELMSYGRPIVCTDVNGLPDTVKEGGITVPPKDPKALASAMNSLLDDPSKCESMGEKAASVAKGYDWNILIPRIEEVYSKVMSGDYSEKDAHSE
ncbi:MAG: glycosyltransferase family 4 protein [Candidatus Methanomethylophilaceae archaeon]|jgi:glycosyltransferase involved in cell wall biosynthesis